MDIGGPVAAAGSTPRRPFDLRRSEADASALRVVERRGALRQTRARVPEPGSHTRRSPSTLDLAGQFTANQAATAQVWALCARYGHRRQKAGSIEARQWRSGERPNASGWHRCPTGAGANVAYVE